jgi:ribonuclease HI
MDKNKNLLTIFTDGSSRGNPGAGGWGAIIIYDDGVKKVVEIGGREKKTTNNRMEMEAVIRSLKTFSGDATIYIDSSYVLNGITKWIFSWQRNDWKTKTGEVVLNKDLWEELSDLTSNRKIKWNLIPGHSGVPGNERCDEIATSFADELPTKLYNGRLENYPIKNILDFNIIEDNDSSHKIKKSSAKAYSYVSSVNNVIKIHKTWAECEARVRGVKARFKKALSKDDEEAIIKSFKEL